MLYDEVCALKTTEQSNFVETVVSWLVGLFQLYYILALWSFELKLPTWNMGIMF